MSVCEIIINNEGDKELYLFGEFQARWDSSVDDYNIIIPYAIKQAIKIGEDKKLKQLKKVLSL